MQTLEIKWLCIAFEQMIKVHPYSFCTSNNQRESESIPGARLSCFIVSCVYTCSRDVDAI